MERKDYSKLSINKGKAYSFELKHSAVMAAEQLGIKPAAVKFKIARNTLRSWLRLFKTHGKKGLKDKRAGPNHIPHKMNSELEERIIAIRTRAPCYGPQRIKHFYQIPASLGAIARVIRSHKLTRKRRRVYKKRRDLRAKKAARKSMTHLQMDVKYLTDISNYWEQIAPLDLPKFQYTVRETKTGMLFLGYARELSELNARTMVDYVLDHLNHKLPFPLSEVTIQTDNGSEFSGQARRVETAPFVQMIERQHGANHVYIRPGHCNANADVESLHHHIEEEFFDLVRFSSREDFFNKIESYRLFFNFRRPNFSKGAKTPFEICSQDCGQSSSFQSSLIPTLDLDTIAFFSYQKGQTIPELAERNKIQ